MNTKKRILNQSILLLLVFLCSMGLYTLSYCHDNKYQLHAPQPMNGIFFYQGEMRDPVYLINGWQYYKGKLLTPADFEKNSIPADGCLAIGQYPGMETGDPKASPHGSMTYRLILCLPDTPASYTLELPEIYSAYRLYLGDGEQPAASMGNPSPDAYTPALRSGSLTFTAAGDVTLLLAVSDWSHLYSGLVYPPAFGETQAVQSLLDQKFARSLAVTILALLLGLFQLSLSILLKNRRTFLSGLICASFAVSVSSTAVHRLFTTEIVPFYNLEIFCRYAVYGLAALLVLELCENKNRIQRLISILAAAFPFLALAVSLAAPSLSYGQMALFSRAAGAYKLFTSLWLIGTVFHAGLQALRAADTALLLSGVCVFASSLAADRLYPVFEPARFGWFSETAGFLFVLILSVLMLRESAAAYRNQFLLFQQKQNLETQIAMQKKHYAELAGQIETIRAMRHDIRHHFSQLSLLLSEENPDGARNYLEKLTRGALSAAPLSFCEAYYVDVLLRYYYSRAQELCIPITINAFLPPDPGIPEDDLCVILGNLLENGLEACTSVPEAFRFLSVDLSKKNHAIAVKVSNSYAKQPVSDGQTFVSTKKEKDGLHGIGLSSVRQTAEKYNGDVWFKTDLYEDGGGIFTVNVILVDAWTQ